MPSPATNPKRLEREIRELEERDSLSQANQHHLDFLRKWRANAGQDVYLYVVPNSVIKGGGSAEPKVVCVTDQAAARMLAYASKRGESVREATQEEIDYYHERNEAQRDDARKTVVGEAAKLSSAHMSAAGGVIPATYPADRSPAAPPRETKIARPGSVSREGAEVLYTDQAGRNPADRGQGRVNVGVKVLEQGSAPPGLGPEAAKAAPLPPGVAREVPEQVEVPRALHLSDLDVAEPVLVALLEAGFTSVELVANASPEQLQTVKGIRATKAAELIAKASELVGGIDKDLEQKDRKQQQDDRDKSAAQQQHERAAAKAKADAEMAKR